MNGRILLAALLLVTKKCQLPDEALAVAEATLTQLVMADEEGRGAQAAEDAIATAKL